jgi:Dolichyl-phosphate-mannose-protein mannosyltransferase
LSSKPKLLLFAAYIVLVVIWLYGSGLRTRVFLIASVLFAIPTFLFRKRSSDKTPVSSPTTCLAKNQKSYLPKNKFLCALALWIAALSLYWALGFFGGRDFTPTVHDEYAYLFQAKTFASGRLCYPPPQFPQFFDAFHILTEKIYASKYPPGHALSLVPGVWLGFPMLMPLLLSTGSLVVFYYLIKQIQNENVAVCTIVLVAVSPFQLEMATTYQSHSTTLFFLLLFVYSLVNSFPFKGVIRPLIAGLAIGLAFATRPLTALAAGTPFALYYLFIAIKGVKERHFQEFKSLMVVGIAFSSIVAMMLAYNNILMGSPLKFPWIEYTQRYMPADKLGFSLSKQPLPEGISPRKAAFYQSYVLSLKRDYDLRGAIGQFFNDRLRDSIRMAEDSMGLVFFLPLAFIVPMSAFEKLMAGSIISLFLAYFFYYGGLPRYHFEVLPFVIYFMVKGVLVLRRVVEENKMDLIRSFLVWQLWWGILFLVAFKIPQDFFFKREFTRYHSSFKNLVSAAGPDKKVILVRYKPDHNFHLDLINNEPDMSVSRNIFALDLGAENRKLFEYFPDRSFFVFDEKTWKLEKFSLGNPGVTCPNSRNSVGCH